MLSLLETRRSLPPKQLREPGPDKEQLEHLLTIAARVPDHGKLAPWRFIVIAENARVHLGEIAAAAFLTDNVDIDRETIEVERGRFTRAPVVVAIVSRARSHPKIPVWEQQLSAGAVAMNLLISAEAAGFSAVWLTEWCAFDRRILDALGLEPDERLAGFVYIGTPALKREERSDRARPDLSAIISYYRE